MQPLHVDDAYTNQTEKSCTTGSSKSGSTSQWYTNNFVCLYFKATFTSCRSLHKMHSKFSQCARRIGCTTPSDIPIVSTLGFVLFLSMQPLHVKVYKMCTTNSHTVVSSCYLLLLVCSGLVDVLTGRSGCTRAVI
jgi:hypothetical protein